MAHSEQILSRKFSLRRRNEQIRGGGKGVNALGRHLLLELFDCDSDAINNLES